MTKYLKSLWDYFKQRTKTSIPLTIMLALYLIFCFGSMVYCIVIQRYRDIASALVFALLVPIFYIGERNLHIRFSFLSAFFIVMLGFGSFLGQCYNVYTMFSNLDDIMHAMWGIVFPIMGFAIIKAALGEPKTNKSFFTYLIFGFAFCLMIAVFWEIYEFAVDNIFDSLDMQEDTIVNSIHSFLLYPGYDHLHTEVIEGIAYTVLYDVDGNVLYTIEGGYLDIGIMDTMWDIFWCTSTALVLCGALAIDRFAGKRLYNLLIPKLTKPEDKPAEIAEPAEEKTEAA